MAYCCHGNRCTVERWSANESLGTIVNDALNGQPVGKNSLHCEHQGTREMVLLGEACTILSVSCSRLERVQFSSRDGRLFHPRIGEVGEEGEEGLGRESS